MENLDPDRPNSPDPTYQQLVIDQGKRFSELEVLEILRESVTQLKTLHDQGFIHGNISWETLRQGEHGHCIIDVPPNLIQGSELYRDIQDLAIVAIEILTGKTQSYLHNGYGQLDWEEECVVSDQMAYVLNRMLAIDAQTSPGNFAREGFHSASALAKLLGSAGDPVNVLPLPPSDPDHTLAATPLPREIPPEIPPEIPVIPPQPWPTSGSVPWNEGTLPSYAPEGNPWEDQQPGTTAVSWGDSHELRTEISGLPGQDPSGKTKGNSWVKKALWLGVGGLFLVTVGVWIKLWPSLNSQPKVARESEAKQYTASMNRAQQATYLETGKFTTQMQALGLGIEEETSNYQYQIYQPHPYLVANMATPRQDELKAFTGFVFLVEGENGLVSYGLVCHTLEASPTAPLALEISNNGYTVQCPQGSANVEGEGQPLALEGPVVTPDNPPQGAIAANPDPEVTVTPTPPLDPSPDPSLPPIIKGSSRPSPAVSSSQNPFDRVSFPQGSCGDTLPRNPALYPVNFYPVYIDNQGQNLAMVQSRFCSDAYAMRKKDTNQPAIQVASFLDQQRAQFFAEFMQQQMGSGEVGPPTPVTSPP